jgi:uncharacterized membrane protein YtjA (UPF0391 family)
MSARMPKLAAGTICRRADLRKALFTRIYEEIPVLHYAVVFLVIALIAAVLGFGGIVAGAASIAKLLFFVFVALSVVAFAASILRKS